ncbi:LacI family DNA-binding transcriptional regulator [Crossiella cryophila]|uniref:DNA-binding LacI/PurR family transcriptional regulator n=1 Tax=Crossiella cryophila TaxID=43355 RepID=A0A7W7C957_9PSEU|nr:DNA-binding LacI/PurR family transcriptional regulator [Crossiella cryophila]
MREVAAAAGVDVSTASRLLRGQDTAYRAETRQRVLDAAEALGYRPNAQARALRLQRQQAIGLLVPDLDNFGFTQIMRGVQEVATEQDYTLMVVEAGSGEGAGNAYDKLGLEGKVDGVLVAFASVDDPNIQEWASREHLPMVLVQRGTPGYPAAVVMDEVRNVSIMVDHLVELGHRRIGHVSGPLRTDTGLRRRQGFAAAMRSHGLTVRPEWICDGNFHWRGGHQAALHILDAPAAQRPTALVVANLLSALGTLSAARELGLSVPHDLSVIAIDEHIVAAHTDPPLTAVKTPQRELGRASAHMLLQVLQGNRPSKLVLPTPPELVVRASTAPAPSA